MNGIKAIETKYKGYRFRSRLEARWAVFFDALGVKWEYEPEGYELSTGWYLPDFWLPDFGFFAEIKPGNHTGKWEHVEGVIDRDPESDDWVPLMKIVLLFGDPGSYIAHDYADEGLADQGKWACCPHCKKVGFVYNGWCGYIPNCKCFKSPTALYKWDGTTTPKMLTAIQAARSARFEHGENGKYHG